MFSRTVCGEFYTRRIWQPARRKKTKTSRLWNNLQCHGFHKKENITNSVIIFYVWMIFAQVKLFHCSGLMWNWALTKHCCRSAWGPPIRLTWKRFNSEQSRLSLLWLLYTPLQHLINTMRNRDSHLCLLAAERPSLNQEDRLSAMIGGKKSRSLLNLYP